MKILEAQNITKIFPGVLALDSVDVSFELGKVHCIVGENGAGKSTLIKCLTGVYEPEYGDIFINGISAKKDKKLFNRIAYVPQEIDLFDNLSVAENLFIPFQRSQLKGAISQKRLRDKAKPILDKYNINVLPETEVKNISVSQQQLLQIARATVYEDYDILMLDEPTTSLTAEDAARLFDTIIRLRDENKAIVFISHKLEEVFSIGDMITVFRNGQRIAEVKTSDEQVDVPWTITQMTGHSLDEEENYYSNNVKTDVLLEVKNLSGEQFSDISFNLKKGEILGFAGLVGAGRSELMQAIFGYLPAYKGNIKFLGKEWKFKDTNFSIGKGMFYLPEERRSQGIFADMSVRNNASINSLNNLKKFGLISDIKEKNVVREIVEAYNVKTSNIQQDIKFLSGGNQQKVIIARAMTCKPKLLIFDEPTKGIDVGAKTEIYRMMKQIAEEESVGIILISSEMNEIMKCSNRIITMYKGKKVSEHQRGVEKQEILSSILGLRTNKMEEDNSESKII
jgi:ribose transport system ATP-binding protein